MNSSHEINTVCRTGWLSASTEKEWRKSVKKTYGIFSLNGKRNSLPLQQTYFVYFYAKHSVPSINLIGMGDFHGNSRTPFHLNPDAWFPCQAEINVLVTGEMFGVLLRDIACAEVFGVAQWSALSHHCSLQHDPPLQASSFLFFFYEVSFVLSSAACFLCLTPQAITVRPVSGVIHRERIASAWVNATSLCSALHPE